MSDSDPWKHAVPRPLCNLNRVVRSTRRAIDTFTVDAAILRDCANEQQAMLVDRCDTKRAVYLRRCVADAISDGFVWIIAGTELDHHRLCAEAKRQGVDTLVHCGHDSFQDAGEWEYAGLRLYLSSTIELRAAGKYNPRWREDVHDRFCPLLVVYDSDLSLCSIPLGTSWDPAWAVRDVMARRCAAQKAVPLLILTQRDHATINPSGVQRAFGMSALLYFDGSGLNVSPAPGGGV
jgi:hypothetical protein